MANLLISYIIYINYDTIFIWFAGSFNSWHNDWCAEYDDHPKRNPKSKRNEKFFEIDFIIISHMDLFMLVWCGIGASRYNCLQHE